MGLMSKPIQEHWPIQWKPFQRSFGKKIDAGPAVPMGRPREAQKETGLLLPRALPDIFEMAPIELAMLGNPRSTLK